MRRNMILGAALLFALVGGVIAYGVKFRNAPPDPDNPDGLVRPDGEDPYREDPYRNHLARGDGSAVEPKPLSDTVKKGLVWLVSQQRSDGGWSQGGGWRTATSGRVEGAEDPSDVGNTCIATLALLRAGNSPTDGPHAKNVARALEFICKNVEKADSDSLYVTSVRNTQLQSKIGPYIDTFLASLVLAEVKDKMPDSGREKTLLAALDKTVRKIEKNQKADGTWSNEGWAAVISQGIATKGLNRARQAGVQVSDKTLAKAEQWGKNNYDARSGKFNAVATSIGAAAPGDAGVALYGASNTVTALQESVNTNRLAQPDAQKVANDPTASTDKRKKAQDDLKRYADAEKVLESQTRAVTKQLDNQEFVAGFGSNGGEEFLSYLGISETLLVKGGKEWEKWDKFMSDGLGKAQDKDGSWSGHHCITGKTFCTSAALLVLMADRAPVPMVAKMKEQQ